MIDLHCHMLPGVDDGAMDAAVACRMAEQALDSGVDTVVLTPHCNLSRSQPNYAGPMLERHFAMLRALLRQRGLPLRLLPGAEVFADDETVLSLLREHRLLTLNRSRYLLVEFRFDASGRQISAILDALAETGCVPVIAHPERYAAVQREPRLAAHWFRCGYVIQLNKGSLLGRLGCRSEQTALELLRRGFAHVIASDAHDPVYRTAGFRSLLPLLQDCCSPEYVRILLHDNPKCIISDRALCPPGPDAQEECL